MAVRRTRAKQAQLPPVQPTEHDYPVTAEPAKDITGLQVMDEAIDELFRDVPKKPKWRRPFLVGLANTGNITAVCRAIGISRQSYYLLLESDDPTIEKEVQSAMKAFGDRLIAAALERAVIGTKRYVVSLGQVVMLHGKPVVQTDYSDLLLDRLLKAYHPELFRERFDLSSAGDIPMKIYVAMNMDDI